MPVLELEIGTIILRTVIMYILIVLIFKLMGKREIGELSILDLVVFLMLGEMAVFAIEEPKNTVFHVIIPMTILLAIQLLTAKASLKSQKFRDWFEGKPSVIISRGKIDEYEMRKQRYNFNDLLQQLRENGTKSVQDVEFAILESSGELSIFEKSASNENSVSPDGYVVPLIIDGKVQKESLRRIERTEEWLNDELTEKGYPTSENISFCSLDSNGQLFMDIKNEEK